MSNPFSSWTKEQCAQHNARIAKQSAKEVGKTVLPTQSDVGLMPGVQTPNQSEQFAVTAGGVASVPNTRQFVIHVDPCPAPRMTRRDKWLKPRRPAVQRYFDFRDFLQRACGDLPIVPDELHCLFHVAMPESWSMKKKREMFGKPHRTRPDRDNFDKAICDALFLEDGGVWKASQEKLWAVQGRVEITMVWR